MQLDLQRENRSVVRNIRITPSEADLVDAFLSRYEVSFSTLVREALTKYLENKEL